MRIEFFYDVVSPYSWLGFEVLMRYQKIWKVDIALKPMLLGGVMKGSGNQPPATLPAKAAYMQKDLQLATKFFQVPLVFPTEFPYNTLLAQRTLVYIGLHHPNQLESASRALWTAYWSQGQLLDEATLTKILGPLDFKAIQSEPVKQALLKNTQDALESGAFGAPWFKCYKGDQVHVFFGSDRFEAMAFVLGLPYHGPVPMATKL